MMGRRMFLISAGLSPLALSLGGCGDDQFPDYRYKMTIYVGDKPFSSVREVRQEQVFSAADSPGQAVKRSVQGQAVIIDLPDGRTAYALLSKPSEPEYAQKVAGYALLPLVPEFQRDPRTDTLAVESSTEALDRMAAAQQAMVKIEGPVELPRIRPNPFPSGEPRQIDGWPMFVAFGDTDAPKSIHEISATALGITNITIEITNETPTNGIESRLPWLPQYYSKNFSGSRFQSLDDIKNSGLAGSVTSGLFSTGNGLNQADGDN